MTQSWRRLDWGVAVDVAGGQQCDDSGCVLKVEPPDLVRGGQGLDESEKRGGVLFCSFLPPYPEGWMALLLSDEAKTVVGAGFGGACVLRVQLGAY